MIHSPTKVWLARSPFREKKEKKKKMAHYTSVPLPP